MDVRFPIGRLEVPERITFDDVMSWLSRIDAYVARLNETVSGLSDEDLEKTYREGAWSVRQLVHHIADSQLNMYQRLKLALTQDGVSVPDFKQDAWAKLPDNTEPVKVSIQLLDSLNQRIVALGHSLSESQLEHKFLLNGKDASTVGDTFAKLAWHEEHHLAHIKIALGESI
ncbi:YfiT family bacillithiol transferase [Staphylococcus canis]|uniref:Metal-dependent hydrolase n=1 Tax=Staphylococcus canis TaxID=2724942 RepID=A0ABS0TAY1_9STAP|nr:putative metal-dependent hydrolase [Staphylococcus canis]MBI5975577.1 putative metal-dependent hydrolase [Staphylococcus canis]